MSSDSPVSIPLGIFIGLVASSVQSLGLTIQRKSHVQNQSLPEHLQRVEHQRPLWLLGFAVFISSNILGSLVQIASLPVVILAPLGAVSLLWNAFFARLLLGDLFSPWMVIGTIFIAGGAILIAIFGIVPEPTRSLEDLLALFTRPTFIVYFSVLGFVTVVCLAITHLSEFSLARRIAKQFPSESSSIILSTPPPVPHVDLPTHTANVTTTIADEINDTVLATERTPLLDRKSKSVSGSGSITPTSSTPLGISSTDPTFAAINHTRVWLAISYASFSGIISGMCLLFAKSGVELLLLTLKGHNQFWRWEAWCLVLGLVAFALLQLWYLHKALVLAAPTLVCPSAFCFYNLSSIVNGLVYFDQFALIPPLHLGLVAVGIAVLLGGVWVVSIQSGPVDMGSWDEEFVDLSPDGGSVTLEVCGEGDGESESGQGERERERLLGSRMKRKVGGGGGPVGMERETRSESFLPNVDMDVDVRKVGVGLGLGVGSGEHAESGAGHIQRSASPEVQGGLTGEREVHAEEDVRPVLRRPESGLYATPRKPSGRASAHRRATDETLRISTSSSQILQGQGGGARYGSTARGSRERDSSGRAVSYTHTHTHQSQYQHQHHPEHRNTFLLSPQLGQGASTFGAGFQIGLSPVSPGFTIFAGGGYGERRRGSAVVGTAGERGPSLMDVVGAFESGGRVGGVRDRESVRERRRRRTVSEGEIVSGGVRRSRLGGVGDGDNLEEVGREDLWGGVGVGGRGEGEIVGEGLGRDGHEEGGIAHRARARWRWLRRVMNRTLDRP